MPPQRFSIAQVTPYPWEQDHEVNRFVERLSEELGARGHRVAVVAPSDSRKLIRAGRARTEAAATDPDALFDEAGGVSVLGVGQSLPFRRNGSVSLPLDVSRTVEELLGGAELDFVHVHEPFAPSASSAALRHSRALNIGTFHSPTERFLSTQVARPLVKRLFGRLDGRTASFAATRDLVERFFPGGYRVIRPGADVRPGARDGDAPEILFAAAEERGALRMFLRALRKLPVDSDWTATVWLRDPGAMTSPLQLPRRLRERVRLAGPADGSETEHLARAAIVVAASAGASPAPELLLRALAGGAVPVAARLPQYEEVLECGDLGLLFEPRDTLTLAAQLERLVTEPELLSSISGRIAAGRESRDWTRTAEEFDDLYGEVAGRRHPAAGRPEVRERLASRGFIHVDLHMHTDHSPDRATPVATLLDAAKGAGLGAIAVTD
ncbi:MAG: glycosyltransferase, partial [Actinomycetota bacterium]|nr:glycosyltransferase [Actinomycetota bacterium]